MVTLVTCVNISLTSLCIFYCSVETKLISKDQSPIENELSPLEQKVDALSQVVEHLLLESKAKDLQILNLENRVSELEKRPAESHDMQITHFKHQHMVEFLGGKKENTSSNSNGHQTVHEDSGQTNQASKYKHAIIKSKIALNYLN